MLYQVLLNEEILISPSSWINGLTDGWLTARTSLNSCRHVSFYPQSVDDNSRPDTSSRSLTKRNHDDGFFDDKLNSPVSVPQRYSTRPRTSSLAAFLCHMFARRSSFQKIPPLIINTETFIVAQMISNTSRTTSVKCQHPQSIGTHVFMQDLTLTFIR